MGASPKLPRRKWTDADDQILREMIAAKASTHEVGARLTRTPKACGERANKLGLMFDPAAARERRSAKLREFWRDPANKDRKAATIRKGWSAERRAAMSERAKQPDFTGRILAWAHSEENKAHAAALNRRRAAARLAWCPPHLLDEYRRIASNLPAAEARRLIEAKMTPFERQLSKVRQGARLETRIARPANDREYSLTGCGLAL